MKIILYHTLQSFSKSDFEYVRFICFSRRDWDVVCFYCFENHVSFFTDLFYDFDMDICPVTRVVSPDLFKIFVASQQDSSFLLLERHCFVDFNIHYDFDTSFVYAFYEDDSLVDKSVYLNLVKADVNVELMSYMDFNINVIGGFDNKIWLPFYLFLLQVNASKLTVKYYFYIYFRDRFTLLRMLSLKPKRLPNIKNNFLLDSMLSRFNFLDVHASISTCSEYLLAISSLNRSIKDKRYFVLLNFPSVVLQYFKKCYFTPSLINWDSFSKFLFPTVLPFSQDLVLDDLLLFFGELCPVFNLEHPGFLLRFDVSEVNFESMSFVVSDYVNLVKSRWDWDFQTSSDLCLNLKYLNNLLYEPEEFYFLVYFDYRHRNFTGHNINTHERGVLLTFLQGSSYLHALKQFTGFFSGYPGDLQKVFSIIVRKFYVLGILI